METKGAGAVETDANGAGSIDTDASVAGTTETVKLKSTVARLSYESAITASDLVGISYHNL